MNPITIYVRRSLFYLEFDKIQINIVLLSLSYRENCK